MTLQEKFNAAFLIEPIIIAMPFFCIATVQLIKNLRKNYEDRIKKEMVRSEIWSRFWDMILPPTILLTIFAWFITLLIGIIFFHGQLDFGE